jgi:hypothetical protein
MRLAVRQGLLAAGLAAAFVALWTQIYPIRYYTDDGSSLGYLLILLVLSSLLLSTSILLWRELPLWLASAAGLALLGNYICYPLIITVGGYKDMDLGRLRLGGWLGMIGAAVVVLAGAPLYSRQTWKPARARRALLFYASLALAAAGFALVVVGLFLHLFTATNSVGESVTSTYWNDPTETHPLALVLIVVAGLGLLSLLASALRRVDAARLIAFGMALLALGVSLFWPLLFAFHGLGNIEYGGWLVVGGGALATVGALAALLLDAPSQPGHAPVGPIIRPAETAKVPRSRRHK